MSACCSDLQLILRAFALDMMAIFRIMNGIKGCSRDLILSLSTTTLRPSSDVVRWIRHLRCYRRRRRERRGGRPRDHNNISCSRKMPVLIGRRQLISAPPSSRPPSTLLTIRRHGNLDPVTVAVCSMRVPYTTNTPAFHSGSLTVSSTSSDSWRRGTTRTTVLTSSRALLSATRTSTDLVHVLTTPVFTPITVASYCFTVTIYAPVRSSCRSTSRLRLSVRSFTVHVSAL